MAKRRRAPFGVWHFPAGASETDTAGKNQCHHTPADITCYLPFSSSSSLLTFFLWCLPPFSLAAREANKQVGSGHLWFILLLLLLSRAPVFRIRLASASHPFPRYVPRPLNYFASTLPLSDLAAAFRFPIRRLLSVFRIGVRFPLSDLASTCDLRFGVR